MFVFAWFNNVLIYIGAKVGDVPSTSFFSTPTKAVESRQDTHCVLLTKAETRCVLSTKGEKCCPHKVRSAAKPKRGVLLAKATATGTVSTSQDKAIETLRHAPSMRFLDSASLAVMGQSRIMAWTSFTELKPLKKQQAYNKSEDKPQWFKHQKKLQYRTAFKIRTCISVVTMSTTTRKQKN